MGQPYLEPSGIEKLEQLTSSRTLVVRILTRLGCRVSEAKGLTFEDIDQEHGTVRVWKIIEPKLK